MTQEFLEAAEYNEPIAMISEGTRMARRGKRKHLSESQVLHGVLKVSKEANSEKRAVFYTHGPRDMDRLRTFSVAAESCGRQLIVNPKTGLVDDQHLDLPDPLKDDIIAVYYKKKRSGTYAEKDYYKWEREFLNAIVTAEDLTTSPEDYVVSLNFYDFAELIDIHPEPGSPFIYSMSEHFGEDDIEERVMRNWLDHFDLRYHQLHASGHLSKSELNEAIRNVNPGKLFPVHTESPEMFTEIHGNVTPPNLGERYTIP
jgi:ribonuclease J